MKIICTVEEFGQLVRGCEKGDCWKCPMQTPCGGDKNKGVEQFIEADNVVDEFAPKRRPDFLDKTFNANGYQPTKAPERMIPPIGSGGEDG